MNIKIVCVGKKHSVNLADAIIDYQNRLQKLGYKISWQIIPQGNGDQSNQIQEESRKIVGALRDDDFVLLLDEDGTQQNNHQLAELLQSISNVGRYQRLVLVIGGAYGVNEVVKNKSDKMWSLSKLVFPHQIVRLLLVEQLYRSDCIINNHPYHHQ